MGSLIRLHMDPEDRTPIASDSVMLAALPEQGVEAFVDAATAPGTTLMIAELRQLGGALGRPHRGGGVVSKFDGQFLIFAGGVALTPEMGMQVEADALRLTGALSPWASGSAYLNFCENEVDPIGAFPPGLAAAQSDQVEVDPDGLFLGNHAIPRLDENGRPTH